MLFVAPAKDRPHALQLAASAKALSVRPLVLARWARFLVAHGQSKLFPELHGEQAGEVPALRLNDAMLEWCEGHAATDVVVPAEATQGALHTNNLAQAKIILDMFTSGREGYASTRFGHADDPNGGDPTAALAAWAGMPLEDEEAGLPGETQTDVLNRAASEHKPSYCNTLSPCSAAVHADRDGL